MLPMSDTAHELAGSRVSLRVPAADHKRLTELAGAHDRSVSAEVRRAIRFYLRSIEQREQRR